MIVIHNLYTYCGVHQNCYFVAHLCVFLSFSSNREICGHNVYKCHQPIDCASHELTHYYFTLLKKVSGTKFLPKLGFQQQIRQFWWPSQFIPTYFWVQSIYCWNFFCVAETKLTTNTSPCVNIIFAFYTTFFNECCLWHQKPNPQNWATLSMCW